MPRMIPARMGEYNPSAAERQVFAGFAAMPGTDNWTILHSVGIAKHPTQSQGEADFVVIIPEKGTFTLEVKGGRIARDRGLWYSENRYGEIHKINNPINEANEASHAFKRFVECHPRNPATDKLEMTVFGFGVMFPDCSFHDKIDLVELADEQLADADDCLSAVRLKAYLLRLADFWRQAFRDNKKVKLPSAHQSRLITDILRPDFDARISLQSTIRSVENKVLELTENQLSVLDGLMDNDRCLVRGGAGTGKTTLALNLAERMCRAGVRTGLFCFNKQLAFDLQKNTAACEGILCDSFTEYMIRISQKGGYALPDANSVDYSQYFCEELPLHFMEAFEALNEPQLDFLILDEGQDLMRPQYLDAMDWILKGGLKEGSWFFFMDAERQDLYEAAGGVDTVRAELKARGAAYTRFTLTDNCRNSRAIAAKIDEIFGTQTRQRSDAEPGEAVQFRTYKDEADELRILNEVLSGLANNGVKPEQIAILSTVRFENSPVRRLAEGADALGAGLAGRPATDSGAGHASWPITDSYANRAGRILFSTVHTFKGLDSPVVILTDVNHFYYANNKMMLYIGMSRAKSLLYVLAREKTYKDIQTYGREKSGGR